MDKVRQTCIEMLEQRGYVITDDDDEKLIGKKEGDKICVILANISKFNVDRVTECISFMHSIDVKHAIVVFRNGATSVARTMVKNSVEMKIELFTEDELQYNLTKHSFVPKHVRMSVEESTIFKEKYGVKFSSILRSDPVSRFYNYQMGDVIKIERKDGSVGYRIVRE